MDGLVLDCPNFVGAYRGEPGVEHDVRVDRHLGTPYAHVSAELAKFETNLQRRIEIQDKQIKSGDIPDMPNRRLVIELAAWCISNGLEFIRSLMGTAGQRGFG